MNANAPIVVHHNGIEITYDENRDLFTFELRGRCRTATSIKKAKEAIDKPEPKDKKPFERIKAWYHGGYGDGWRIVEITSIAEPTSWGTSDEVWISDFKSSYRQRAKIRADSLYPQNETTDAQVKKWKELDDQEKSFSEKKVSVRKQMKCFVIPKE